MDEGGRALLWWGEGDGERVAARVQEASGVAPRPRGILPLGLTGAQPREAKCEVGAELLERRD